MRTALLAVGIIAVLVGLVWIGQGTGVFPYPRSSFMINQSPWITYGAILGVVGLMVIFVSRRV